MKRFFYLLYAIIFSGLVCFGDNLSTGEWVEQTVGQTTNDHLFTRNDYNDSGVMMTYDNVVSFKSGSVQTIYLWLDDDEIYQNEAVQALTPIPIRRNGPLYNEITYNSYMCKIYVPMGIEMTYNDDDECYESNADMRMPKTSDITMYENDAKVIDGITYRVYSVVCKNTGAYGSHFSGYTADDYEAFWNANGHSMRKNDAPLVALYIQNNNQNQAEGRLPDMIIANQEFGFREAFATEPQWGPNEYRFIYGEGGNGQPRFQKYNRIALYGSAGIVEGVLATSISLNVSSAELTEGSSLQLTATVLPVNATNKTVIWTSSNTSIATVNSNGLVTAKSPGTATITATTTDGTNLSATCSLVVKQNIIYATSVSLNHTNASMTEGDNLQLTATVLPTNATNRTVTWKSSKTSVATVNSNGLVTAIAPGSATITATTADGTNLSATCAVTVNQAVIYATSVSLDQTSAELTEGETLQLTATVLPTNATNSTVTWSTSNNAIATVNSNGLVTAKTPGTATITVRTNDGTNLSATCVVTVTDSTPTNYFAIPDTTVFHGETIVIPVSMTNEESIIAFQTDIFLPEGLEIVQEDGDYVIEPSGRMTSSHGIMSNEVSNGAIRVICYSSNYKPFTGNSGDDLFYITVKVADNAAGDYTIQLKNTLLTNSDFVDLIAPDVAANVNVKSYLLGDANNSGTVTVTDVVVTAQYVLEYNPNPFVFEAADVNMDNNITVADVSRIAWMILNPTMNVSMLRAPALWNNRDCMSGEDITMTVGESRTVSIALNNEMDYIAFQLDLTLPDGLAASNFRLTDRADGHAFDVNTVADGKTRALCYSPALTAICGNEGALLTFDVTATGRVDGDILVDGIELVTTDCQIVRLNTFTIGVNDASAFSELNNAKAVARVDYFNLAGQQVEQPESGVTIVVTTYTDGSRTTTKLFK